MGQSAQNAIAQSSAEQIEEAADLAGAVGLDLAPGLIGKGLDGDLDVDKAELPATEAVTLPASIFKS